MFFKYCPPITALCLVITPSFAEDFTNVDINAINDAFNRGQNAEMEQNTQQIIYQVMRNPRFNELYQQHQMAGGTDSPEQFAYKFAATGGFTPGGISNYRQSEAQSAQKFQQGMRDYQQGVENYRNAYGGYTNGYSANQNEFGNRVSGNSTYVNPNTGEQTVLPHTWQNNTYQQQNGQQYNVDQTGQYNQVDPNNSGWQQPIYPQE